MPDSPASECFPLKPRASLIAVFSTLIAVFSTAEAGNCAGSELVHCHFSDACISVQRRSNVPRQKSTLMSGGGVACRLQPGGVHSAHLPPCNPAQVSGDFKPRVFLFPAAVFRYLDPACVSLVFIRSHSRRLRRCSVVQCVSKWAIRH